MSGVALPVVAEYLDRLLRTSETPDYPCALNGVQMEHRGPVTGVAAAVDVSMRIIRAAIAERANLLIVHHGLFWGGLSPLTGPLYERVHLLITHDIALYSTHLPLDAHERFGNSALLAREIGLEPSGVFGRFETIHCGVRGECDIATAELHERAREFARLHGGAAIASAIPTGRHTRRWAIVSGAGASADTIREALLLGVDTLIVGEGAHWTAVDADDKGLVIIYAGHYATETPGVRALAEHVSTTFGIPWTFLAAPTGL
jgi:dinuclear metal center YbgI/SA1388 family protein